MADIYVGVTDRAWYQHLRSLPTLDEVNFWHPKGGSFRSLPSGGLFLFKLKYPDNAIVGGGFFVHHSVWPLSSAWEAFGEKNGAATIEEMIDRLSRLNRELRAQDLAGRMSHPIGCTLLTQPFFFRESEWFTPPSWKPNIQEGMGYQLAAADGDQLMQLVQERLLGGQGTELILDPSLPPRYGAPILVQPRLGQGAFRLMVGDAYHRRCAVTRDRVWPALEAAHIVPYVEGGPHEVANGLLLRRDLHRLFDLGYMSVTPDLKLDVSTRIKDEFHNGRAYYEFAGIELEPPQLAVDRPDVDAILWHRRHWGFAA